MRGYNKVILMGNLTRDPELRYTSNGKATARLGLAVNRTWRTETGETKEEVTFVDVDAWGKQAETIAQYMKKGRPIFIEGRLKLDSWDDKQTGQKKFKMGVVLENFQFLGEGQGQGQGREGGYSADGPPDASRNRPPQSRPAPAAPAPPAASSEPDNFPPEEDDVPF